MKLRIRGHSVRLRLNRHEVAELIKTNRVEEVTRISSEPGITPATPRAFTLIELLVVIAIIAILAALPLRKSLVDDVAKGTDVAFYFYAADNQINYLFNSHNYGRGNEPLIHITAIPLLKILSGYFTNGLFHLVGTGGTNAPCQIQAASNLPAGWQTIGTVTADGAGLIQFDDVGISNQPQRFYRLSH